jgi:hypothetical protein
MSEQADNAILNIPHYIPLGKVKYFDTNLLAATSTSTVGFLDITNIPQGLTQSQRLADTLIVTAIELRGNFVQSNADVFTQMRFNIFRWCEDTIVSIPVAGSIFNNTATQGVYTPLSFENRRRYLLISKDHVVNGSGTATAVSSRTQTDFYYRYLCSNRIDFNAGATTGVGKVYFSNFSDSVIVPFPVYNMVFRVWYSDNRD